MKEKEKAIKIFQGKEVFPQEEWNELIEDLKAILSEGIFQYREAVIKMKWEIGDRLFQAGEERITAVLQDIAKELHISERELWFCLAFRKKYPTLKEMWERIPEGKNISWHKLIHNYIDFEKPKLAIPIEEKYDEWGITDWWQKQENLHKLKIRNKKNNFTLLVTLCIEKNKTPEKLADLYHEITDFYVGIKGWNKADLDRNDYARIHRAIKQLLEKAKFDKEKVLHAIKWCFYKYKGTNIDWTINTVVSKYAEAVRKEVK